MLTTLAFGLGSIWAMKNEELSMEPPKLGTCFHIRIYMFGTDQGGDQLGSYGLIRSDFLGCLCLWHVRQWCFHHQLHLVCKREL